MKLEYKVAPYTSNTAKGHFYCEFYFYHVHVHAHASLMTSYSKEFFIMHETLHAKLYILIPLYGIHVHACK